MYKCAECGKPVIVYEGQIIRVCPHETAIVIAELTATATGESTSEVIDVVK